MFLDDDAVIVFDVIFTIIAFFDRQPDISRVRCEISRQALDDNFAADGKDKLQVFRTNRKAIEDFARKKYLAGQTESDGSILIRTLDLYR